MTTAPRSQITVEKSTRTNLLASGAGGTRSCGRASAARVWRLSTPGGASLRSGGTGSGARVVATPWTARSSDSFDEGGVGQAAAFAHGLQAVAAAGALE